LYVPGAVAVSRIVAVVVVLLLAAFVNPVGTLHAILEIVELFKSWAKLTVREMDSSTS
jgi:hypothetical protein